ncbi:MAG: penicillin-binding protein 1A [Candidatus Endobugula sp.]
MKKALLPFLGWSTLTFICATTAALLGTYLYLNPSLPDVDSLKEIELQVPLRVFSADNKLIGEFGEKRRDPVTFEETPKTLIDAVLSAEDDGFYSHQGVDITGLLRAVSQLAISGSIQSGGSTITMQVARNFFLSRNQTFSRKFNEILLALKIEQELSKEEILTLYLNKIYLGNRAYGVKTAAKVYYGKKLADLSLAQVAMIAGLPKAPSSYNPIANPSRALIRRNWILGRMQRLNKISSEQYDAAINEPVSANYHGQQLDLYAPYVAEIAREKALELFGDKAYTGGYNVYTTVDSRLQEAGQHAVVNGLLAYTKRHGYRGPEKRLDTTTLLPLNTNNATNDKQATDATNINNDIILNGIHLGEVNLLPWLDTLGSIPSYGKLIPAAVISVQDKSFTAILASGDTATIEWQDGLNKAGKYVNENFSSPVPNSAKKIVQLGDVVRIFQKDIASPDIATPDDTPDTPPNTDLGDGNEDEKRIRWELSQIPAIQGALTAIDPNNGAIKTVVGGFDFVQTSFNRATQAKRLPGSNFKPFVYSVGLEHGLTAASIFNDAPIVVESGELESAWRPENASGKFYGPTRLRKALYLSRNLVSIRLLRNIGIDTAIEGVGRFGIDGSKLPKNLSMILGTYVMTPLEVATGYSVFANSGYKVNPFLVERITDSQEEVLFQEAPLTVTKAGTDTIPAPTAPSSVLANFAINSASPITEDNPDAPTTKAAPRVMDERVAYIMNSILRDVVQRGTAKRAKKLGRTDIGGKTGTTNGPTDAWFSGFNSHLVATAWVGFDDNRKIGRREYGGTAALPIWVEFMETALKDIPNTLPPQPEGVVTVRINPETGKLTMPDDPNGIDEMFLEENVPTELPEIIEVGEEASLKPVDIF